MKKLIIPIILILISLVPFAYPLLFPYTPPLEAIDTYQTHHVTDTTYFGNITKNIQSLKEEEPCVYTLLGWDNMEHLYYQAVCEGVLETYIYIPTSETNEIVDQIPTQLSQDVYPDEQLLEIVRATGVRPQEHEPYTRPLLLLENSATQSPTGTYIAFVTKRLYSVQDIVLISQ